MDYWGKNPDPSLPLPSYLSNNPIPFKKKPNEAEDEGETGNEIEMLLDRLKKSGNLTVKVEAKQPQAIL